MEDDPRKQSIGECVSFGDAMAHIEICKALDREDLTPTGRKKSKPELQTFANWPPVEPVFNHVIWDSTQGWGFWDETAVSYIGGFTSRWEAEKIFSLYCFAKRGVGDQDLLYIVVKKAVKAAKGKLLHGTCKKVNTETEEALDKKGDLLEVSGQAEEDIQRRDMPVMRVPLQSKIVLSDLITILQDLLRTCSVGKPTPEEVGAIEMMLEWHRQYKRRKR